MPSSTSKGVHVAAGFVCVVFTAFVLIHLLWAVGITWGLQEVSAAGERTPDASIELTLVSLAAAAVASGAIVVTIGRVGWLRTPLPESLLRIGAWLVFAWPAIGSINPATTWGQRAVTVPLALAALVVAGARAQPHVRKLARPPAGRAPVPH